ncbi:hypothetical protein WNZ14_22445 [Hoeflea sp. AS60]|uniref:hypothetical protein n=1 Tax=Hoeflea sp. AS60 TaxID=3135780 RepID=UPI00317267BB
MAEQETIFGSSNHSLEAQAADFFLSHFAQKPLHSIQKYLDRGHLNLCIIDWHRAKKQRAETERGFYISEDVDIGSVTDLVLEHTMGWSARKFKEFPFIDEFPF